ncbi:dTDP-4-keto-6-deoxy-D-glucose epimerase [Egibacter rhizosphaerae]|uniref:dTDP-4-keto-6-deoxy-D-glucose epimerase n=1 Tax=Egibacter rhizosphaerae TaxID=1670831 RepID=A0A411YGK1_9ACTN|nr:dTDP-4-dehydrorhamnose 3,5-epimerase family protein [Egibacter rhizosphaerae]QBI20299.1 dTDP-4-keto-6-deoxy-D-glucose epimerase [Egibacter rhizosphaerae]
MAIAETSIPGLLVVDWPAFVDERGWFRQTYQLSELEEALGREVVFRQGNHSRSHPGVLRGFHAEPWDKLVYVARGVAFCAVADLRENSPTYAHHETFWLGDPPRGEHRRLFLSEGLANAFLAMGTEPVDYLYDVTAEWRPGVDKRAVAWDDLTIGVDWPIDHPQLSEADRDLPRL